MAKTWALFLTTTLYYYKRPLEVRRTETFAGPELPVISLTFFLKGWEKSKGWISQYWAVQSQSCQQRSHQHLWLATFSLGKSLWPYPLTDLRKQLPAHIRWRLIGARGRETPRWKPQRVWGCHKPRWSGRVPDGRVQPLSSPGGNWHAALQRAKVMTKDMQT